MIVSLRFYSGIRVNLVGFVVLVTLRLPHPGEANACPWYISICRPRERRKGKEGNSLVRIIQRRLELSMIEALTSYRRNEPRERGSMIFRVSFALRYI